MSNALLTVTPIDFTMFSSIFDFIIDGVTTICGVFTIFPINIALGAMLFGLTVNVVKKFLPKKSM